jgi:hypothetical protein
MGTYYKFLTSQSKNLTALFTKKIWQLHEPSNYRSPEKF